MKKLLCAVFLCLGVLCSFAQSNEVKKPSPGTRSAAEAFRLYNRPVSEGSRFQETTPFYLNCRKHTAPDFIKSTGDGSQIFGTMVSANSWANGKKAYGVYSFEAKEGTAVQSVLESDDFNTMMAVYANGFYYTYHAELGFGDVFYILCRKYDTENWKLLDSFEPEKTFTNVPFGSSMAYVAQENKIYAVTYGEGGNGYNLSTMNETDGSFTKVCTLEYGFITLAADSKGVLYGVTDNGDLYKIAKDNGALSLIGATGKKAKYVQSMTCDPNTDKLYWGFINDEESALYEVNKETATVYKISDMPDYQEFVGLFVKPDKVNKQAPASVTELQFIPSYKGSLSGKISCKAPLKNQAGESLSGEVEIKVYCGDEVLVSRKAAAGETVQQPYTFDSSRLYALYAIASNQNGNSAKSSITVFVGKDKAGVPQNVRLTIKDKKAELTWEAPQNGLNDGYFNPAEVTYEIVRCSSSAKDCKVATTAAGVTEYTETVPSATAEYSYKVTAVFNGEKGGTGISNAILSVGAYELPYVDEFDDGNLCRNLYTYVDVDGDKNGEGNAVTNSWFWKEDETLMQITVDQNNPKKLNDWLITPAIHLDGKNLYDLTYSVNMGAASNLKITLGTSTDPKDHTVVLDEKKGIYDMWQTKYSTTFRVKSDGVYYLGFYSDTDTNGFYFNLFDIKIEKGISALLPDSVSNLEVIPGEKGKKQAKITYNAPKTRINGELIQGTFKTCTYRNGVLINESEVTGGQQVSFMDNEPKGGSNVYKVIAIVGKDKGLAASATVWVGPDQPDVVGDMKAFTIDKNMHVKLTWEAPAKGVNGGYFDISQITYSVWRGLDKDNFECIQSGLTQLSFVDTEIEKLLNGKQDAYYYAVTANVDNQQSDAIAKYVVVGTLYKAPVYESFENGKFRISPWTIESLEGSFGFECMRKDPDGGGYAQDADYGLTKFMNPGWGDPKIDSRLKTPVFTLEGTKNPSLSFFMLHWEEIPEDNHSTLCQVEISVNGGEFKQIGEDYLACGSYYGWKEHRISLAEYKNAETVQFAFRGKTENSWMYYYIDNIRLEEQEDYDLAVLSFEGAEAAKVNDELTYSVTYFNRGLKPVSDYSISLSFNNNLVASGKGETIQPGEIKRIELKAPVTAYYADQTVSVTALIDAQSDQLTDNNTSPEISVKVEGAWFPVVENLTAKSGEGKVNLSWTAPVIPTDKQPVVDGAEDYVPFAIDEIGDWITYDGDGLGTGCFNNLPEYEHRGENQAWQVWTLSFFENLTGENIELLKPHSGEQAFISWYANVSIDGAEPFNDDYLISPQVCGSSEVSFWIHSIGTSKNESYEIMYSATTREIDQFKKLKEGIAENAWREERITLPADARYFAIRYTGALQTGIMVDDISYVPAIYDLQIVGYNVYRNGVKLNEKTLDVPEYADAEVVENERYAYQVSAVYNLGESNVCTPVEISYGTGIDETGTVSSVQVLPNTIRIRSHKNVPVSVYTVSGEEIISASVDGVRDFGVESGIYLVKVDQSVTKVVVW